MHDASTISQEEPIHAGAARRLLGIGAGEGRRLAIMAAYAAAAVGGVSVVGYATGESLFLSRLPSTDTPYLFILPAISNVLVLLIYSAVLARARLQRVTVASSMLLAAGALLFRLVLAGSLSSNSVVLGALYLFVDLCAVLTAVQFWTFAGQIFNPREARRLFGLIAAGGTLSSVGAGLAMAALARRAGIENLLFIVACSLLVCALCAARLGRYHSQESATAATPTMARRSLLNTAREILASPLARAIAALTALSALLINLGYYQFYLALQATYAGQGRNMVVFLGAYQSIAGLAALFMQLFITNTVMRRFGIAAALLFYPLGVAIGGAVTLATAGALVATALIQGCLPVFQQTIGEAAFNVLYVPLPAELREQAKTLMQVVFAAVFGLAGVVFLLFQHVPAWRYYYWSVPLLALALLASLLVMLARKPYTRALASGVSMRRFAGGGAFDVADDTTVRVVARILRDADTMQALHTLSLIESSTGIDWDPYVVPLLDHASPDVRAAALRHLGRPGHALQVERVSRYIEAPEANVRAAAISAYCAIMGLDAGPRVAAFLGDRNPRVRAAAVAGLVQFTSTPKISPRGRIARAGVPAEEGLRALLPALFKDADIGVRVIAIRAAGSLGSQEFVPYLMRALGRRATASAAIAALANFGGLVLPSLAATLEQETGSRNGRAEVPRVLDRIGSAAAARLLLAHSADADTLTRTAVHRALAAMRARGVDFPFPAQRIRDLVLEELGDYYGLYMARAAFAGAGEHIPLGDTIQARMERDLTRVFFLLDALYPGRRLQRVREVLDDPEYRTRATAVELLDTVVDRTIGEVLLPLVEASPARIARVAEKRFGLRPCTPADVVSGYASGDDPWLRACAIFVIGTEGRKDMIPLVTDALHAREPLVRETALAASRGLLGPALYRQLLARHASDQEYPSVSRFARARLDERSAG